MRVKCVHCGKSFDLKLKCLRCKHEWIPRREKLPDVCPNCKSPYWNKKKVRFFKKGKKTS